MAHSSSNPGGTPRRGRHYRPPADPTPYGEVTGGADARIAWLLGTTRAQVDRASTRRAFITRLTEAGITCDESRVSRWEAGLIKIPDPVISAYEAVLALAPGSLLAPARLVADGPEIAPRHLRPAPDEEPLEQIVDAVVDGEPTGSDWMQFATALRRQPGTYIRGPVWEALTDALVGELSRSLGPAYAARRVAARRLLADPDLGPHLLGALDRHFADPSAPRLTDAVAMIQDAPDGAARLVQLLDSVRSDIRDGAARGLATLLARGLFPTDLLGELELRIPDLLGRGDSSLDVAELVRRLPPVSAARLRARGRRQRGPDHGQSEPVAADLARVVAQRVASQAVYQVAGVLQPDPMLERLILEALFHTNGDRRNESSLLLGASVFRAGIAGACEDLIDCPDRALAVCATRLLAWCIDTAHLPVAFAAAVAGPADGVRRYALTAVGGLPAELTQAQARLLLDGGEEWRSAELVDAVLYALGMHGHQDVAVAAAPADPLVAELASWWRRKGARVLR